MEHRDISYENQKIVDVEMGKRVQKSFIEYAMSVIVARALPDVRDGLKPVHRRILYAMYQDKLTYDRPFCKSATTVGNVLGRYHPHGDASVYDAMVRLAQPFNMRYPLVEGHGNFGNVDGDGARRLPLYGGENVEARQRNDDGYRQECCRFRSELR